MLNDSKGGVRLMSVDPDDTLVFAQPGKLTACEIVNGKLQAFAHGGFVGEFSAQEPANKAILQAKSVQALVADACGQQLVHFGNHALVHTFINTLIDAGVEFRTWPVDGQQQAIVEGSGNSALG